MKNSIKNTLWMVSIITLANWAAAGADMNSPKASMAQQGTHDENSGTMMPEASNKASGIVGMEIQNQQGEHLGHVKDVVFDLRTERVSYAVMTTSSKAMPINEKLLAVPLNAFTVSPDQKHLVLNADKAKVEAAAGFDSKNWPNVGNPSWGAEPFWQKNGNSSDSTMPKQNDK